MADAVKIGDVESKTEVYQDPKATYQFTEKEPGKFYSGSMPVSPSEGFKATEIQLFSFARPHMRAFHFAWMSFFIAFVCWFAFAPLIVLVKQDLELTLSQVFTSNILAVAGTVMCRFAIGPLCDKIGPKICQFFLLSWICIFTLLGMSVNSFWSLCIVRFCIGFGGAAFVVTQYWTTRMFANNIVGTANATTAGWGNLGGGVTQMLMVAVYAGMRNSGLGQEDGWRLSFIVPAAITGTIAIGLITLSDDTPRGDLNYLYKEGVLQRKTAAGSARAGMLNLNSWILGIQYACCFGVELHMNATAALYFATRDSFGVGVIDAGLVASLFGWMNLFARSSGGILSDALNKTMGLRGRLVAQSICLVLEGLFLVIFSKQGQLKSAIPCLVVFSFFTQATEGATFGIVPYVSEAGLGGVCAVVGAWGNIGAVCWGMMFKFKYIQNLPLGYEVLGYIVIGSAIFSAFIRIKGQTHLFGSLE
jgi:NNP family nitrate/nitrite transporter-like MFS transporter